MPDPNPYESPQTPSMPRTARQRATMLVLLVGAAPAGVVAFFITCSATSAFAENSAAVYAGIITGMFVAAVMVYFAIFGRKRS